MHQVCARGVYWRQLSGRMRRRNAEQRSTSARLIHEEHARDGLGICHYCFGWFSGVRAEGAAKRAHGGGLGSHRQASGLHWGLGGQLGRRESSRGTCCGQPRGRGSRRAIAHAGVRRQERCDSGRWTRGQRNGQLPASRYAGYHESTLSNGVSAHAGNGDHCYRGVHAGPSYLYRRPASARRSRPDLSGNLHRPLGGRHARGRNSRVLTFNVSCIGSSAQRQDADRRAF